MRNFRSFELEIQLSIFVDKLSIVHPYVIRFLHILPYCWSWQSLFCFNKCDNDIVTLNDPLLTVIGGLTILFFSTSNVHILRLSNSVKNSKRLPNLLKRAETRVILIDLKDILFHVSSNFKLYCYHLLHLANICIAQRM